MRNKKADVADRLWSATSAYSVTRHPTWPGLSLSSHPKHLAWPRRLILTPWLGFFNQVALGARRFVVAFPRWRADTTYTHLGFLGVRPLRTLAPNPSFGSAGDIVSTAETTPSIYCSQCQSPIIPRKGLVNYHCPKCGLTFMTAQIEISCEPARPDRPNEIKRGQKAASGV